MLAGRGIVELRQICWGDRDSSNRLWVRLGQKANRNMDQILLVMNGVPAPYDIMSYRQVIYEPILLFSMSQTLPDQTRDDGEISFHWEHLRAFRFRSAGENSLKHQNRDTNF